MELCLRVNFVNKTGELFNFTNYVFKGKLSGESVVFLA